jgi:hydroxyacylglutathione hydrolase
MLCYKIIPVTAFQQNCSLLWCDKTRRAAVVDPGGETERILEAAREQKVNIERIWLTHGHVDHVGGTSALVRRLGIPVEGPHRDEQFWLDALPDQSRMFGFPAVLAFVPDRWLADGDILTLGEERLEVIHTPGHTPGHVVFYSALAKLALVGDVLFAGSIGRTDFPRSNHAALIESIRKRLFVLGDDIQFIPGHGPMSSFGEERLYNPYVGDKQGRFAL